MKKEISVTKLYGFASLKLREYNWLSFDNPMVRQSLGAGIAQWSERRTRDRKVAGSSSGRTGGRIFFSRVNFLC